MSVIYARIHIAPDGTMTGTARGVAPGEHDAAIILSRPSASPRGQAEALEVIHQIQREIAQLPVLDHRSADEIIGYDADGLFA